MMGRPSALKKRMFKYLSLPLFCLVLIACDAPPASTIVPPADVDPAAEVAASTPSAAQTLVPTYTPVPSLTPRPTQTAVSPPTATVPGTAIPFDQTVVTFRYTIPALGLDRRFEGKLGGQVIVADEATGVILQRNSQGNVVAELEQVLPELVLEPVPEGCDTCVRFTYSLPEEDIEADGWLRDKRLLGSVENYLRLVLGPHFPPETAVALHRSPSPYAPAHSLALTTDGRLWLWLATEDEIAPPTTSSGAIEAALANLDVSGLAPIYEVDCVGGTTRELLQIGEQQIDIRCPEFALPSTLIDLYAAFDELAQPHILLPTAPQRPTAVFPLLALVDYQRADGERLTLFNDGQMIAITANGPISSTLPLTQTVGIATSLLESGELQFGLTTFLTEDATPVMQNRLLVRGFDGVYDGAWETAVSLLTPLDDLLAELSVSSTVPTPTASPTTDSEATPAVSSTPEPLATPELTPTPTTSP